MTFAQFFQDNLFLFLLLGAAIVAIVVYELKNRGTAGKSVSPSEAAQLANKGGKIIDVRPAAEYKKGHIAGAINLPADQFEQKLNAGKIKPDQAIILVDKNGMSAKTQAKWLHEQGYGEVYLLSGGLMTWQEENLPLVK